MLGNFLIDSGLFGVYQLVMAIWLHWCDLADAFGGIWDVLATIGESVLS